MPKICNSQNCNYNVFGGGYCKIHQYKRTDLVKNPLARTALKKSTAKGRKAKAAKSDLFPADRDFYMEIWEEREHVCYCCDKHLGHEPLTLFFDHILDKGIEKYKHLRHEKQNIVLLCWDCHTSKVFRKKLIALKEATLKIFGL